MTLTRTLSVQTDTSATSLRNDLYETPPHPITLSGTLCLTANKWDLPAQLLQVEPIFPKTLFAQLDRSGDFCHLPATGTLPAQLLTSGTLSTQ